MNCHHQGIPYIWSCGCDVSCNGQSLSNDRTMLGNLEKTLNVNSSMLLSMEW